MKNKKLAFILVVLMIILPKADLAAEPKQDEEPTTSKTVTEDSGSSTNGQGGATPPTTTPAPKPIPASSQTNSPDGMVSHSETMKTSTVPSAGSDIVKYLNRRIRQILNENPVKDTGELSLSAAFNEERSKLEAALVEENSSEDAYDKAEKAIENFRAFSDRYMKIENMLEKALENLNSYQENSNQSIATKYEALMMQVILRRTSTLRDAEKALKAYEDFKKGLSNDPAAAPAAGIQSNSLPLNDEYRKYFDEILKILKKHIKNDTPEMESFLQQILKYPEQLKKLYDALSVISEEDYDDDDDDEDFLSGIYSLFKIFF